MGPSVSHLARVLLPEYQSVRLRVCSQVKPPPRAAASVRATQRATPGSRHLAGRRGRSRPRNVCAARGLMQPLTEGPWSKSQRR